MALLKCEDCGHSVSDSASACPSCGRPTAQGLAFARQPVAAPQVHIAMPPQPRWHPGLAAVLSLFIPGVGQLYKGQVFNGLAWFVCVVIGYVCFIVPGLVLHLFCVIGAGSGDPTRR